MISNESIRRIAEIRKEIREIALEDMRWQVRTRGLTPTQAYKETREVFAANVIEGIELAINEEVTNAYLRARKGEMI